MSGEPVPGSTKKGPPWPPEVGIRLAAIIESIGTKTRAAKIAGVSAEQLAKWQSGKARASFAGVMALAKAANRSLDWLAWGDASLPRAKADQSTSAPVPLFPGSPIPTADDVRDQQLPFRHHDPGEEMEVLLVRAIVRVYAEHGQPLPSDLLARVSRRWRRRIEAASSDPAVRIGYISLARTTISDELDEEARAPGSGKSLA